MPGSAKVNGTWQDLASVSAKVNGSWKDVVEGYSKVNGTWQQWFAPSAGMELIQSIELSSTQNQILISNIPQTYKHLHLIGHLRSDRPAGSFSTISGRINNNSSANSHTGARRQGASSFLAPTIDTLFQAGAVANTTRPSGLYTPLSIDILNYTESTKRPTALCFTTFMESEDSAQGRIQFSVGTRNATEAVTSLAILDNLGDLVSGSTIELYGVF